MLISQLIKHLEEIKKDNGDLQCVIFNTETMIEGELNIEPVFTVLDMDEEDKVNSLLFVDFDTFAAFTDTANIIS